MSEKFIKNNDDDGKRKKGRNFLIVQNDIKKSKDTIKYLKSLKSFRFLIVTRELDPNTGRLVDYFFYQSRYSTALSNAGLNNATLKPCKGSVIANIAFIYKIQEPWKKGLVYYKEGVPSCFRGLSAKEAIRLSQMGLSVLDSPTEKVPEDDNKTKNILEEKKA